MMQSSFDPELFNRMLSFAMVCYGMLWYGMIWYGMYGMLWYFFLCYEICMLCYAMVYVVKEKHSATVAL